METTSIKICNTSNNQVKIIITSNYGNTKNDNQFNIIYKYQCKCNNSYIGTTKNKNRIYQHDLNVRNKNVNHSTLAEHLIKTGQEIDTNNFKTIYEENHNYKRFFV